MESVDQNLLQKIVHDLTQVPRQNRQQSYNPIVHNILEVFVRLPNNPGNAPQTEDNPDGVLCYTREVISYGLLYTEFEDAIKEGDGLRIVRCWRFYLPVLTLSQARAIITRSPVGGDFNKLRMTTISCLPSDF